MTDGEGAATSTLAVTFLQGGFVYERCQYSVW